MLIPIVVALIVGIHMSSLTRLFRVPLYSATGWFLMACSLGSLLIPGEAFQLRVLGVAVALILWGNAAILLVRRIGLN